MSRVARLEARLVGPSRALAAGFPLIPSPARGRFFARARPAFYKPAMTLHTALAVAALAGSALLFSTGARVLATVTLVTAAAEVLMTLGLVQLRVAQVPLALVLGLALAVPGLVAWFRATAKTAVSAAAVVALVGVLQVVAYVGLRR